MHSHSKPYRPFKGKPSCVAPRMAPPRQSSARNSPRRNGQRIDPALVFNDILTNLIESNNGFAWACCPFHSDSNPSFSVNLHTGWHRCFSTSCGKAGPNIVSFVSALMGISIAEARRHVEARYGY